jgi:prepilin-type processing-associated H-X9-DG protein
MCPAQTWTGPGNPPRGYSFVRGNVKRADGSYAAVKVKAVADLGYEDDSYYLSMVSNPSQFLTMIDGDVGKSIYRTSEITQYTKPTCINADSTLVRHGGSANALFCDGHIETLKWAEIDPDKSQNTAKVTGWLNMN